MALMVPLPAPVQALIARHRSVAHPGLLLDKYVESWEAGAVPGKPSERVQKPAVQAVALASQKPPEGLDFAEVLARHRWLLEVAGAQSWCCATVGPLTLHL